MTAPRDAATTRYGWAAGLGCRRSCPAETLRALLDVALERAGIARTDLNAIASIDAKQREPGLLALAAELGLELQIWSAAALCAFEHRLSMRSERAFAELGCYGVAESAALAAAEVNGPTAELVVPRAGHDQATVALARYPL